MANLDFRRHPKRIKTVCTIVSNGLKANLISYIVYGDESKNEHLHSEERNLEKTT